MQGKIKFKLIRDPFFTKRVYKVFVNHVLVGEISNKKPSLDAVVDYGKQTVKISGEKYEKQIDVSVGPAHIINPFYVSHSRTYGEKLPAVFNYLFYILIVAIMAYLIYEVLLHSKTFPYYLMPIFFLIFGLSRYNEKEFRISKNRLSLS